VERRALEVPDLVQRAPDLGRRIVVEQVVLRLTYEPRRAYGHAAKLSFTAHGRELKRSSPPARRRG
jgi:hypothetical protein